MSSPDPRARPANRRPTPETPVREAAVDHRARTPAAASPTLAPDPVAPAYVVPDPALDFDGPLDTALFHRLDALRAFTAQHRDLAVPSLAVARGYERVTLFALAEIARHYVLSGGTRLALVLFEGLTAVAPAEPYFALGLAYTLDRAGRADEAIAAYRRALSLGPPDGQVDLNLAELLLAAGDVAGARVHLARAEKAASARGDVPLADKARAILARLR